MMALRFRNLTVTPDDPVDEWGVEGLLAAVDRGGAADWARIAEAVAAAPHGPVADDLAVAIDLAESPGGRALLQAILDGARATPQHRALARIRRLAAETDLSQTELAARLGTSRTRLSTYLSGAVVPSAVVVERLAGIARSRRDELV